MDNIEPYAESALDAVGTFEAFLDRSEFFLGNADAAVFDAEILRCQTDLHTAAGSVVFDGV